MTYLEAINKVLTGLRETTVADLTATRTLFIGQLVNAAKTDIEDMGPWMALRTTVNKTLTPSTDNVALTTETSERSYLFYDKNLPMAFVTTTGKEHRLGVISREELLALQALNPSTGTGLPQYVAFGRATAGLTAYFFPTPDAAYTTRFRLVVPQDDIAVAGTAFTIPAEPIWREALVRAMEERGEDFSGPIDRAVGRAREALWAAVMNDFGAEPMTFEAE